jgi:hypothetical protein
LRRQALVELGREPESRASTNEIGPISTSASGAVTFDLSGTPAQLTVRVVGAPGAQWTFVSYTWSRGPLSYALLVHLLDGLTRTDADQIALSIK